MMLTGIIAWLSMFAAVLLLCFGYWPLAIALSGVWAGCGIGIHTYASGYEAGLQWATRQLRDETQRLREEKLQ